MIPALSFGYNRPIQKKTPTVKPLTFGNTQIPSGNSPTVTLQDLRVWSRAGAAIFWEIVNDLWWSDMEAEQTGKTAILELWEYSKAVQEKRRPPEFSDRSRKLLHRAALLESDAPSTDIQRFILACISLEKQPGMDGYEGATVPVLTGPFI